ncbi:MAG TPA: copper resistance CopC family protein [Actinomycetota bacterium]|nr:copper resistance CopC family protein [Actinomycetota bacterium]
MKSALYLLVAAGLVLAQAAPALAHAERIGSKPDEGARVGAPPSGLRIDFSEPPIGDARFVVLDGCGRDVVQNIDVSGTTIDATLAEGQPGEWQVDTRVVSGVDGHATSDNWSFAVRGNADCEQEPVETTPPPEAGGDEDDEGGGSTFLLIFAAGTLVVIGLALALRRKTG